MSPVVLVGSADKAVDTAADLCEEGSELGKPYAEQLVLDRIKRFRATRDRAREAEGWPLGGPDHRPDLDAAVVSRESSRGGRMTDEWRPKSTNEEGIGGD